MKNSFVPGYVNVVSPEEEATPGGDRGRMKPHLPRIPSLCTRKRMEWSINRLELGHKIVAHSNMAFVKGNFSLCASGTRFRLRKPVSLVFKLYPFGLGKDENHSLTLEIIVECRSDDLKSIGKVYLEISVSMDEQLISTRSWKMPLKTFKINDFLPHEIVSRSFSKMLNLVIEGYITFE